MRPIVSGLVLLTSVAAASVQEPLLSTASFPEAEGDEYQFHWPIQRVAIIGAGPSGLAAYHELTEVGLNVRIFERDSVPGGNWHYTEAIPLNAPVPNVPPPIGDYVPSLPPEGVDLPYSQEFEDDGEIWRDHSSPKPVWDSLTCTAPAPLQQFVRWPWPEGTRWELTQYQVRNYVRSYASYLNINSNDGNPAASYNTRVERVEKRIDQSGQERGWKLWLKSLEPTQHNTLRATWWTEDFDAVVIAVGRFNAPSMPSIPGLKGWVQRFPDLVRHSRQYRRPEAYANQTVLIIGAATSGSEISRDLNRHAAKIYLSVRPSNDTHMYSPREIQLRRIPKNTTLVGETKQFLAIPEGSPIQSGLIELKNGTILSGIDSVILATGYRFSFPFLPQYYDAATYQPHPGSAATVSPFLPLDGSHIRDLYLDQFYLRDPTLAFLGVSLGTTTFPCLPYVTLALAKVWTNTAKLPNSQTMQKLYLETVKERGGFGKHLLFLGPQRTFARVAYLMGWLNSAAAKYGGKQIDGLPKYSKELRHYWDIAYAGGLPEPSEEDATTSASFGIFPSNGAGQGGYDDVLFYEGDWLGGEMGSRRDAATIGTIDVNHGCKYVSPFLMTTEDQCPLPSVLY